MTRAIETYHITAENIYNFDEKGFMIGVGNTVKRDVTVEQLQSGQLVGAKQDGNREFISVLACICADGSCCPPALVYQGKSYDLQSSWVEDLQESEQAFFAVSEQGWTNDALRLQWLEKLFNRHTKDRAGNRRRLLIVDGHSSHVNMTFIEAAHERRIIIMILPSHSTHRLQPLDVGLFAPLSMAYSQQLTLLIHNSLGLVSMTKRLFWPLFWRAWTESFTPENVNSAFKMTGIWPLNPDMILAKMKSVTPPPPETTELTKTPMTSHGLRRLHRKIKQEPSSDNLDKLLRASERLAAQQSILAHEVTGLREAIKQEKRKRNRGKRLNLVGDKAGGPVLFSPAQVQQARAVLNRKEQAEVDRKAGIEARKAAAVVARKKKAEEKAEKAVVMALQRRAKAEKNAQAAEDREARKEARRQSMALPALLKSPKKAFTKRKRAMTTTEEVVVAEEEEITKRGFQGRSIKLPRRYKN